MANVGCDGRVNQFVGNRRESEKVEVPKIPAAPDADDWVLEVGKKVVAASASSDPEAVMQWYRQCTRHSADPDTELGYANCPEQFRSLDTKLGVALVDQVKVCRDQSVRLAIKKLDENAFAAGTLLGGRRAMYEIIERMAIGDGQGLQRASEDLMDLHFPAEDTPERTEAWAALVEEYIGKALREGLPPAACYATVRDKLRRSKKLEPRLMAWENANPLRASRTWQGLLEVVSKYVQEWQWDCKRAQSKASLRASYTSKPPKPAAAVESATTGGSGKSQPKGKGKDKGPPPTVAKQGYEAVLRYYGWVCRDNALSQSCDKGQACPLDHGPVDPRVQAELRLALQARKDAGGSSRGSSPANSPRSSVASQSDDELREGSKCFQMYKYGECKRGDSCPWLHAESAAEHSRVEAAKAKRKGKGKGKSKSKPNAAAAPGAAWPWAPML